MPSSLLFAGLVATWLAVLVPMAARRRQPMTRPSDAALSSRVLQRPGRRNKEVGTMDHEPTPRYRPGRGGYDPEAAALAARARYVFRQRMVLVLALLSIASGLFAGGLAMSTGWWVHLGVDLCLLGYLVYLRRQVRIERAIRARRLARIAGDPRPRNRIATVADELVRLAGPDADRGPDVDRGRGDERIDSTSQAEVSDQEGSDTSAGPVESAEVTSPEREAPALPPLHRTPPPQQPAGTQVLEFDDEDPELHELEHYQHWGYRRAAGQ